MKLISLLSPRQTLRLINFWPPYLFSGIAVISINEDITEIVVRKKSNLLNRNYFGTHFGGSLYAMCDPFYVFILLQYLKDEHITWDIGAEVDFVKATAKPVYATFSISRAEIENIRNQCLHTFKLQPEFSTDIMDAEGTVVARVRKKIYVRRKDAKTRFAKPTGV